MKKKMDALRADWTPGNPFDRSPFGFRVRHGNAKGPMSKHQYFKLQRAGRGPLERDGLISVQAELEWDRAQAKPPKSAAQRLIEREKEARRQRARHAALQSKASKAKRER